MPGEVKVYNRRRKQSLIGVKQELPFFRGFKFETKLKKYHTSYKNHPTRKKAENIFKFLNKNIPNLVIKDINSNTFFILPNAEELMMLLEANRSNNIQENLHLLKQQIFDFISFQNALFQEDSKRVSFYFMKNKNSAFSWP